MVSFTYETNTMLIKVSQEDIDTGVRGDPCKCMVAKAGTRAYGFQVEVGTRSITKLITGERLATLPYGIYKEKIAAFDRGEKVEPFEFEV